MRRLVLIGATIAIVVPAGGAVATSPPDSPPPDTGSPAETTAPGATPTVPSDTTMAASETTIHGTSPEATDGAAETATVYDESGNPVAAITVTGMETGWTDYQEGDEPDEGNEYVRVIVEVESAIPEGTFGVGVGDFALQSNNGFVTTADNVPTAAQADAEEEIVDEADLANGEAIELALTFQVVASVGPQSMFYRPDDDRLVDVAEFE